ncbi:flippase [Halomarina halobia]|uniref:Flippase n=1 Tax=Halomarina halobia TaxID=3033386 RepID=A0ABD6AD74_9EURY|nr:flippase [Halomarina sp. PSR21]
MTSKSLQTVLGGGSLILVGTAVQLALGFVARVIAARYLGSVDYGALALGITLVTFLSTICLLGTDIGVARFLPRFDDGGVRRGVLISAFSISAPVAGFTGIAIALFPHTAARMLGAPDAAAVLQIFGLVVPFAAMLRLSVGGVRGLQRAMPRVYSQDIALPVARLALIAAVIIAGGTVLDVAYAYLAAYALAATLSVVFLAQYSSLFDRGVRPEWMYRRLLVFSTPLVLSSLAFTALSSIDVFLLSFYLPTTRPVGIYQAVYPLSKLLSMFAGPFGFILLPALSELDSDGNTAEIRRVYRTTVKWIFVLTLPVGLVFLAFPRTAILYTLGSEYVVAGPTLAVLSLAYLVHSAVGPNTEALTSLGASRLVLVDHVLIACVNIALNALLIPRYSYFGAAIATALSFTLLNVLVSGQLYRRSQVFPISSDTVRIGITGTGSFAAFVWVVTSWLRVEGLAAVVVVASLFAIAYVVIVLRFGIGPDELALFESLEHRFDFESSRLKRGLRRAAGEK